MLDQVDLGCCFEMMLACCEHSIRGSGTAGLLWEQAREEISTIFRTTWIASTTAAKKGTQITQKNPSSWGTWVRKANLILVYLGKQPSVWSPPPPLRFIFSTFCTSFDPLLPPIPSNHSNHSETSNGYNSETETEIESYGNLYFQ